MVANKQTQNSKENSHILNSPSILIAHSELIRIRAWALLPILQIPPQFSNFTPNSKSSLRILSLLQILKAHSKFLKFHSEFETLTMWF